MLTVHHFRIWNLFGGRYIASSFKYSAGLIAQLGCEPIPGTAEEVDEADLGEDGAYVPDKAEGRRARRRLVPSS